MHNALHFTHVDVDFRLHVYDTTAPLTPTSPVRRTARQRAQHMMNTDVDHDTSMKVLKTIRAHPGGWTITDSHLSPDNQRYAAYDLPASLVLMARFLCRMIYASVVSSYCNRE